MENNTKKSRHSGFLTGVFFVLAGAILFSIKAVLIKNIYQIGEADFVSVLCMRMVFSLPFYLYFIATKRPKTILSFNQKATVWFLGVVGYYVSSILDFAGLAYVSASLERIILFIYPTFVVLMSTFIFRTPISKPIVLALLIAYTGVLLAFMHESLDSENIVLGGVLVLGAAFTYAIYLIGTQRLVERVGTLLFTSYTMTIATFCILVHYAFLGRGFEILNYSSTTYVKSFFMAIFCTVLPSFMISEGIRRIGSSQSAIVASVGPISTIILANIFLGERLEVFQIIGGLFVVCGVTLISTTGERNKFKKS